MSTGQTIATDLFQLQLESVPHALKQKELASISRIIVLFFPDYTSPHVARLIKDNIRWLAWETLCHPSYHRIFLQKNCHLLHFLDNQLRGKWFTNEEDLLQALTDSLHPKLPIFTARRITQLEAGWQKVVDANGDYFEDELYVKTAVYTLTNKSKRARTFGNLVKWYNLVVKIRNSGVYRSGIFAKEIELSVGKMLQNE